MIIWFIGLSGSGKTTIGHTLYQKLKPDYPSLLFVDGDRFREVMGNDLGFSYEDRQRNARRFSQFCQWLDEQSIHLICCVLSNFPEWQEWNRANFRQYFEIYLDASLETLHRRDTKRIYADALAGRKTNVVGVDIPFVAPAKADLVIDNNAELSTVEPIVDKIIDALPNFE